MSNLTKALAIDCEMVGAGYGGSISVAARVSLVDENGACIYDTFIKPDIKVTDYRTAVSGIIPENLSQGKSLSVVQQEVKSYIKGRTLVGHSLENDLGVLKLSHPEKQTRDTAKYPHFKQPGKRTPSLKYLAKKHLGLTIQNGSHDSVQVTDYRTFVSGITAYNLAQGKPLHVVKQEVASYIKGRILVGHSVDKSIPGLTEELPEISLDKIVMALTQLRKGKARGEEGIAKELLNSAVPSTLK